MRPAGAGALTGDNIYGSFPNLYTLRGTKPRWALDYVESLETWLAAVEALLAASGNINEIGWLNAARRSLRTHLGL